MLKDFLVPIHRAGWPFIGIAAALTVLFMFFVPPLAWLGVLATAFCTFFFRDPERIVPARAGIVVSPADGLVSAVERAVPPKELGMGTQSLTRVSVFLSVFDVHINRVPADGKIAALVYHKGKFLNAASDKASDENERQAVRLTLDDGRDIAFVQIAGLVARRIICDLRVDQTVRAGERFGLIRFGSRTDVYLPEGVAALVAPGQRMIGGETVIADLQSSETQRPGEVRLMPRLRRRGLPVLSVNRLLPNALTLLGLCAGLTAVRMALIGRWEIAIAAMVVAMLMDTLDGGIARLMGATSEFGAQLDSLADVISFGVAPGMIVYLWALDESGGLGWALALVFAVACALRLARFNTALGAAKPYPWLDRFFTGVPAPAGAGLALLPMVLSFELGPGILSSAWFNGFTLLFVAALMVSKIPTFSAKRVKVPPSYVGLALIGLGAFAAFLVSTPWVTLGLIGIAYLASIPVSMIVYRRLEARASIQANPES